MSNRDPYSDFNSFFGLASTVFPTIVTARRQRTLPFPGFFCGTPIEKLRRTLHTAASARCKRALEGISPRCVGNLNAKASNGAIETGFDVQWSFDMSLRSACAQIRRLESLYG